MSLIATRKLNLIALTLSFYLVTILGLNAQPEQEKILKELQNISTKIDGLSKKMETLIQPKVAVDNNNKANITAKSDPKNALKGDLGIDSRDKTVDTISICKEYDRKISELKGKIGTLKSEKSEAEKSIEEKKKELDVKNKRINSLLFNEKSNLDKEIEAIIEEQYTFPAKLVESIKNRASSLVEKPANIHILEEFYSTQKTLIEASKLLASPYNSSTINSAIQTLNKLVIRSELKGLLKSKTEILQLLNDYCQMSVDLAKGIVDTSEAAPSNEKTRKELLDEFQYLTGGYPYLQDVFEMAKNSKSYRFTTQACH